MKKSKTMPPKKNTKFNTHKQPDIRDDLDNRKNEEQLFKGDDITHNVKYHHNQSKKHK
ncbi:MAG TPA: hypothetical protein VGQ09_03450 [Chitinophagaceae bacterium]|jgi:hypothetical protein|nr:hypothetical protein [Chitinophagaceae bacterium]